MQPQKSVDSEIYDITIIGGGPAGLFGAFYAGMRNMKTKIIESRPEPGGQLSVIYPDRFIYDVPGYPKVLARDLIKLLVEQASKFNPKMLLGEKLENLTRDEALVIKLETDKGVHFSKTVLIAVGVGALSQNRLDIPGARHFEGRGVFYHLGNESDFRGKNVVIIGGGDTAVGWALTLKDWASMVTLVHRRGTFRAQESSVVELFHSNVKVKIPWDLKEVKGDDGVKAVTIHNNKTGEAEEIESDMVLIGIGFSADLSHIYRWGLELEGNLIRVNGMMETNLQGVYAAGDIASQAGAAKLNLITTSFAQATIAINRAKKYVDPLSQVFPGHSSEKRL